MKKIIIVVFLGLLNVTPIFAINYFGLTSLTKSNVDQISVYGAAFLNQVKAESINIIGPLQFNQLTVAKSSEIIGPVEYSQNGKFSDLKITGPMDVKQVSCHNLSVIGPVKAKELVVQETTEIIGTLDAKQSHFQDMTITADKINLEDVEVGHIVVKNDSNKQVLHLRGKTVVNNDIVFESGKGTVIVEDRSVVIKGEVKGGMLEK